MDAVTPSPAVSRVRTRPRRTLSRGQALVLFVMSILVLLGFTALVIDVSWYWANTLRVQRAADAAALAGAVYLPASPGAGITAATNEALKNGYVPTGGTTCGVDRTCIVANPDPANDNRMIVTISAPVSTYFMRIFGVGTINATRTAKAEYVLPVPMGSPLNYFGVYGKLRTPTGWTDWDTTVESGGVLNFPTTAFPIVWTTPANAFANESPSPALYATTVSSTSKQDYGVFNLNIRTRDGAPQFTNGGIRVFVQAHSNDATSCQIGIELSWDGGADWTTQKTTPTSGSDSLTDVDQTFVLGGNIGTTSGDSNNWWGHNWIPGNFSNGSFAVRIQGVDPDPSSNSLCTGGSTTFVDYIEAQVDYQVPDPNVDDPTWQPLGPQGSWTGALSQGADMVNGDPYLAGDDGGTHNSLYNPGAYYDYAVEMSAGSTNGAVSIFDPVYCATDTEMKYGMGDHWYAGTNAVSTFYDLYDTHETPYNTADDTWIGGNWGDPALGGPGSANPQYGLFRRIRAADWVLFDSSSPAPGGVPNCAKGTVTDPNDGRYWHDRWWPLATGLQAGHTYRIRVQTTDPSATSDQLSTNALNNFSIFATAAGTLPRVYGLGSMVAFSPLPGGQNTEFYMAQIAAVHAGKTMRIQLYDPGDTNNLGARLQILQPTTGDYSVVNFSYTANRVARNGNAGCNNRHESDVSEVQTSAGGGGFYNGCWLTISIRIPDDYTAPKPATETNPNAGGGWWKVRYRMDSGSDTASDLTTWKVNLSGNPVHLIVP